MIPARSKEREGQLRVGLRRQPEAGLRSALELQKTLWLPPWDAQPGLREEKGSSGTAGKAESLRATGKDSLMKEANAHLYQLTQAMKLQ